MTRSFSDAAAMLARGRKDWETPAEVFGPLDEEFGFTLDVCATPENAKLPTYYTEEQDALSQPWEGVCWMNPPYGQDLPKWVSKARQSAEAGATVVCLVPARTDTRWFHDDVLGIAEVRFVRGRIKFVGAEWTAPFPCMVLVYLPAAQALRRVA